MHLDSSSSPRKTAGMPFIPQQLRSFSLYMEELYFYFLLIIQPYSLAISLTAAENTGI